MLTTQGILSKANLSATITFVSENDKDFILSELTNILIHYYDDVKEILLQKPYKNYNLFHLRLPFTSYAKFQDLINPVFDFIKDVKFAQHKTELVLNLSFNDVNISSLDISRFVVFFNEIIVEENNKKSSTDFVSIKTLNFPDAYSNIYSLNDLQIDRQFIFDYNIDFSYLFETGTLGIKCISGESALFHREEFFELLKYIVFYTYYTSQTPLGENETIQFEKFKNKYNKLLLNFINYKTYRLFDDTFNVQVDLSADEQFISVYWDRIKMPLFLLYLMNGGNRINESKCALNYDSYDSKLQYKGLYLKNLILDNVDIVDCSIDNCIVSNSFLHKNEFVTNCVFKSCVLGSYNNISHSRFYETDITFHNDVDLSVIKGNNNVIQGSITNSTIKNMSILSDAIIENCVVV